MTGDPNAPDLAALAAAVDRLTEEVHRQGALLGELVERLRGGSPGLTAAEPAAGDVVPGDALWQRLGLVEGERRNVTILFADVSGFTALSERLDAEEFQLVMKDTMAAIAAIITRHDGYIEKFIGDAVCAIFGAPTAHDDEPQRAARSALEINRVLAERATARPDLPRIGMHAGINTGIVIAGTVGDGTQFGVMGDTINTAARLMNLATEGEIFVSAETARRLRREFRLEDRGAFEVKGKASPVAAFNVLGELTEADRGSEGRLHARFIDRTRELAQLSAAADAAADGEGGAVVIVGEPGVDKTRLVHEVVADQADRFRVIRGSARVVGEQPLGVLVEAFGPHLDEFPPGPDVDAVVAVLRTGTALPPDFELIAARALMATAAEQPLMVVLDDIESADPASLELARYLTRATRDSPILWLLVGRWVPPLFHGAAGGDLDRATMRIEPLDDDDVAVLLDELLPGALDGRQRARLAYQADGNPEFAEEIVLSLIEEGLVAQSGDGSYRLLGDPDALEIPSSVAELVEARIDRVSTNTRVTLQDAAVIGVRFSRTLLAAVATMPAALDSSLAELVATELVVAPPDRDDPHAFWSFRSHVVREVAYDSILRRRRPKMHRAVADALLRLEPERAADNVELVASHYELSDEPALAVPYLRLAIEDAEASQSVTGVVERTRRALAIRDREPDAVSDTDAAWLLEHQAIARLMLGDEEGLEDFERAVALRRGLGVVADEAALHERVGWYLTVGGDPSAAGRHLVRAQELVDDPSIPEPVAAGLRAGIAASRAFAAGVAGKLTVAFDAVDGAASEARSVGDAFTEARALLVNGVLFLWDGRPLDACERLRQALELSWAHGFAILADRCGRWLVQAEVEAGDTEDALRLAEPLLARADDRGDPSVAVGVRAALAELWLGRGELDLARSLAGRAVEIADERSVAVDAAAEAHLTLGRAALVAGESADEDLARLRALLDRDPWLGWRLESRYELLRARAAQAAGDLAQARQAVTAARNHLGRAAARRERLFADLVEGEVLAAEGDEHGLALVQQALDAAEDLGSSVVAREVAEALGRLGAAWSGEAGAIARARAAAALDEPVE